MQTIGIVRQVNIERAAILHEKTVRGMSTVRFEIEGLTRLNAEECARVLDALKAVAEGDRVTP